MKRLFLYLFLYCAHVTHKRLHYESREKQFHPLQSLVFFIDIILPSLSSLKST